MSSKLVLLLCGEIRTLCFVSTWLSPVLACMSYSQCVVCIIDGWNVGKQEVDNDYF